MTKPSPIGASPVPPAPFIEVRSKNKLLIMVGNPPPYKRERRGGYALFVMRSNRLLQCDSCHEMNIFENSLYGFNSEEFHNHFLCENCLSLPKDFTIFEVKINLRRKSSRNPSGIKTEIVISTVAKIKKWMREVVKVYPGSTITHLKDNLYENINTDTYKSARLAYILKYLWDYLPEREV